jgi:hypothetical protein
VELVRLCGISGAARLTGLNPERVQAGYELETGDVLPRVAHLDPEVVDGCVSMWIWAESAGASASEFICEMGKALRLPPKEAERLWRAMQAGTHEERRNIDTLRDKSGRILDGSG